MVEGRWLSSLFGTGAVFTGGMMLLGTTSPPKFFPWFLFFLFRFFKGKEWRSMGYKCYWRGLTLSPKGRRGVHPWSNQLSCLIQKKKKMSKTKILKCLISHKFYLEKQKNGTNFLLNLYLYLLSLRYLTFFNFYMTKSYLKLIGPSGSISFG